MFPSLSSTFHSVLLPWRKKGKASIPWYIYIDFRTSTDWDAPDIGIEQIAVYAHNNTLPAPVLHLSSLLSASSTMPHSAVSNAPVYSESADPWNYRDPAINGHSSSSASVPVPGLNVPSSVTGGLGTNWWKNQANVEISIVPEKQGFILTRYTVYMVQSDVCRFPIQMIAVLTCSDVVHFHKRGAPVTRRYSEFTYLFDCLVRRYPFRLIPSLPPKRLGGMWV